MLSSVVSQASAESGFAIPAFAIPASTIPASAKPAPAEAAAPAEEPLPAMASSRIPADRLQQYSDLALAWM
jgi:hypothetical protein